MPGLVAGTGKKAVDKTKFPALTVLYVLEKIEVKNSNTCNEM